MADNLPLISQLKSLFQAISGDIDGARRTQENFSRTFPVVSQVRSAVEAAHGDTDGARETQKAFVQGLSDYADAFPVVGHIKGGIHYAHGDKDSGDNAMKSASRTTGAMAGGAAGFFVGGPAGAVAGGIGGAALMDGVTTEADSAIHKEYRPAGLVKHVKDIREDPDAGKWFDTVYTVVADGATGYGAGKAVVKAKTFHKQHGIRKTFEAERKPMVDSIGKPAAKDMVEAADRMKSVRDKYSVPENKPHITSVVRDKQAGTLYEGHNQQIRRYCRRERAANSDVMSDYSRDGPTHMEERLPEHRHSMNRPHKTCAEHRAYDKFYKGHPDGDPGNTRVSSVRYDRREGKIKTVKRCDNCLDFSEAMGEAPGDLLDPPLGVPNHPGFGKWSPYGHAGEALRLAGGCAALEIQKDQKVSAKKI